FHALVSALSQGVPALAVGWSHKYEMLYEDYNFSQGILDLEASSTQLVERLAVVLDKAARDTCSSNLNRESARLKIEVSKMWEMIYRIIDESQLTKRR